MEKDKFKQAEREAAAREKEELKKAREFLQAVPKLNIGALFCPPIWGPAHGWWLAIVFYPLWLWADNVFYAAYTNVAPNAPIFGVIMLVMLTLLTFGFSYVGQLHAVQRAISMGQTKEEFIRKQRFWTVACVALGVAFLVFATYYNLCIRTGV